MLKPPALPSLLDLCLWWRKCPLFPGECVSLLWPGHCGPRAPPPWENVDGDGNLSLWGAPKITVLPQQPNAVFGPGASSGRVWEVCSVRVGGGGGWPGSAWHQWLLKHSCHPFVFDLCIILCPVYWNMLITQTGKPMGLKEYKPPPNFPLLCNL